MEKKNSRWIEDAHLKKDALRKELKVPKGKDIPGKKLEKAEKSPNKLEAKRAKTAVTLRKLNK